LEDKAARRFEHSAAGFRALVKWLGKATVARIVFEPTGPYHRAFERALSKRFPLVKVNPLQARRFAQTCGTHAKTDAVDAGVLAHMGAALGLAPDALVSDKVHDLRDLQMARSGLIKERTRLRNRVHVQTIALLKRQTRRAP
jgi:transposase